MFAMRPQSMPSYQTSPTNKSATIAGGAWTTFWASPGFSGARRLRRPSLLRSASSCASRKGFGLFTRLPIKEGIDLFEEQSLLLIRFNHAHVDQSKMEHYLERMTPKTRNSLNALTARRQSARHPLSHDVRVYFNNCVCGHGTLCKLNA